jgi:hypothetical protein
MRVGRVNLFDTFEDWDNALIYGQLVAEIHKKDSNEFNALLTSSSDLTSVMVFSSSRSTRAATVKSF